MILTDRKATTVGYLPEEERSTAYYLFSRAERYECRLRLMDTRSLENIRFFGTPTSGDPDYDNEMRSEIVDRHLTIAEMAEYFKEGTTVRIVKKADTKKIYERITDHLIAWREAMNGLNYQNPPIEDLILLDEFANKVYEHARWQFKDPYTVSLLEKALTSRFGTESSLNRVFREEEPISHTNPPPARESFNDLFIRQRPLNSDKISLNGTGDPRELQLAQERTGVKTGWKGV